ncbi:MAG: nucleotidyltransferase domain-containing protein [Candidatus Caldarchaeum sp.]
MGVVEERRVIGKKAIESAVEAVRQLEDTLGPVSAAVIGSYARRDFNQWSDIDLLVVSPNFNRNILERFEQVKHVLKNYPDIEIIPLTPHEFERQRRLKTPSAQELAEKGALITDSLNIFSKQF